MNLSVLDPVSIAIYTFPMAFILLVYIVNTKRLHAENLRVKFDKYDEDASGQISKDEFSKILAELIKVKTPGDIPQERFNHYWREVDQDQSGYLF